MPALTRQSLCQAAWTAAPIGDLAHVPAACRATIPACIPGCVHTDLMAAALVGDPAMGFNEKDQLWIGQTDWEYRCRFEADEALLGHERIELVCDGLDTVATVELNGCVIGAAANMFHPHRFDARPALQRGENDLVIRFKSPLRHIRGEEARLGARPVNGDWDPYIFIRKAAYNFGWDWAPKIATSGIWKAVRLEGWSGVRILAVRPHALRMHDDVWRVTAHVDLEWSLSARQPAPVFVDIRNSPQDEILWTRGHELTPGAPSVAVELDVHQPRLWWPRGHGAQPRYFMEASIFERELSANEMVADIPELANWRGWIGIREVRLNREPDACGSAFTLEVNGTPIFCKGANWVPDGLFPTQMTRDRYRRRLEQAAAANMNMLRVWGGGVYESDDFYEICDELGILVWQDFMFACAMYPEEPPYPALIETEARHQITRLSSHPSVALWCGGNECVWAHDSWGSAPGEKPWKERLGDKTWGRGYYLDLLPGLMAELDPSRPYWPNSPWSGSESVAPNDEHHGDRHTWDLHIDDYRKLIPRFCSEFGHQSPANYSTLIGAVSGSDLRLDSPALTHRQRAAGGTARHIDDLIARTFRQPRDFDEWHYLAQLAQARALRTGIEWLRVNQPRCMGALLWQLNDVWPGLSWSIIDSVGKSKLAYAAVQRAFQPRALTIQPLDGQPYLIALNDTDEPWDLIVEVRRFALDGAQLARRQGLTIDVPARSATPIAPVARLVGKPDDPTNEMVRARSRIAEATWFFRPDYELRYPSLSVDAQILRLTPGTANLILTAKCVVRDAVMDSERLPTWIPRPETVDESPLRSPPFAWRTLVPGDTMTFVIRETDAEAQARTHVLGGGGELVAPPFFCCANWFGRSQ